MAQSRMCPNCRAFINASDRTCPYCQGPVGQRAVDRRMPGEILGGLIPQARFTTVVILLINAGLFVATVIFSMRAGNENAIMGLDQNTLIDFGAKDGPRIYFGQWWRLVTAGFLHGGIIHIVMNSWAMFDLGTQVEEVYGTSRMIVVYFLATVFGFLASTWWNPLVVSIGASAGIFGLIGAMIALGMRHKTALGSHIRAQYTRWAVYGLLFGLLPGFRFDNAAHIGGLAAGFGVAYVAGLPRLETSPIEKLWRLAAIGCLLLTIVSFLKMYISFAANNR